MVRDGGIPPLCPMVRGRVLAHAPAERASATGGVAGFTLVEMLVTLVIVALAAALAFQVTGGGSGAGRRAARLSGALGAEIGLLRAQALRSGLATRLAFDPETGLFLSSRAGASPIPTAPLPVAVEAASPARTPGEIRFLADGSSSGGRIVIGPPGARAILSVGTLTAQVRREAVR